MTKITIFCLLLLMSVASVSSLINDDWVSQDAVSFNQEIVRDASIFGCKIFVFLLSHLNSFESQHNPVINSMRECLREADMSIQKFIEKVEINISAYTSTDLTDSVTQFKEDLISSTEYVRIFQILSKKAADITASVQDLIIEEIQKNFKEISRQCILELKNLIETINSLLQQNKFSLSNIHLIRKQVEGQLNAPFEEKRQVKRRRNMGKLILVLDLILEADILEYNFGSVKQFGEYIQVHQRKLSKSNEKQFKEISNNAILKTIQIIQKQVFFQLNEIIRLISWYMSFLHGSSVEKISVLSTYLKKRRIKAEKFKTSFDSCLSDSADEF